MTEGGPRPAGASSPPPLDNTDIDLGALAAVDWEALSARYDGRRDRFEALLRNFIDTCAGFAARLRQALAAGDVDEIAAAAHALVGVLSVVGARLAAELARQTSVAAIGRDIDAAELAACLAAVLDRLGGQAAAGLIGLDAQGDPVPRAAVPVRSAADPYASISRLHSGTAVLVVDDQDISCEVLHELLTHAGLIVDTACDGTVAVAMAAERRYGAILMDMEMPVMGGLDAARHIRAAGAASVPILALTANAEETDRRRCLDAGMNDFIGKPFDGDEVLAKVLHWLGAARRAQDAVP